MTLIERLMAAPSCRPKDLGCETFRRFDQPRGSVSDVEVVLVGVDTIDEIVAALTCP